MGLLVRSDYEVTLKMLRTDGEVRATGTYVSEGQPEEEDGMIKLVHLQRVHPDGKWLATLASPPLEIRLWPQKGGAHDPSREPVRIALPGVDEHIEQFRWLSDGKTLALMGNHQAWVVAARAGAKPVPVFDGRDRENNDMRVLPDGFFIRSSLEGSWPYPYGPGQAY